MPSDGTLHERNRRAARLLLHGHPLKGRDQIRGLLDEDKEAQEAAALHAGCPSHSAAKDNTIIAVDPAHFTPADPREVVAEFYDAMNDLLRGFGPALEGCLGNKYVTTTHAINSCIIKIGKVRSKTAVPLDTGRRHATAAATAANRRLLSRVVAAHRGVQGVSRRLRGCFA